MKTHVYVAILICMTLFISNVSAAITYKSSVDYDYGFYKVIGIEEKPITYKGSLSINYTTVNYTNKNLTINVGDTVVWTNYDQKDWSLTIISEQGLWSETNSRLKYSYQRFNHTFTKPGIYTVYTKENDRHQQNIIVNDIDKTVGTDAIKTSGPIETPVSTPLVNVVQTPMVTMAQTSVIPEKTRENTIPGFEAISFIMTILLTLYFNKKYYIKNRQRK